MFICMAQDRREARPARTVITGQREPFPSVKGRAG